MKKNRIYVYLSISFIFFTLNSVFSQDYSSIYFIGGKSLSSLIYHNSNGEKDKQIESVTKTNIGFNFCVNRDRNMFRTEIMLRQAGAKSIYNGTPVIWDMNYIDIGLDYFFNVFKSRNSKGVFTFAPGIGFSAGYLLSGYQYIDDLKYSLLENESFNNSDYMIRGLLHFRTNIARSFFITAEYRIASSLKQIERQDTDESTKNFHQAIVFGIGLRFH